MNWTAVRWRNAFLLLGFLLILVNLGHATMLLLFATEVPDDLMTLCEKLLAGPSLLGLVSIGGAEPVIRLFKGGGTGT
jgi:hypothetical protein